MSEGLKTGGCHCGAVQWQAMLPDEIIGHECNCSMCQKVGFIHVIAPRAKFKLLKGEKDLTEYRFNTGVAKHYFCSRCGVKSFYVPRSNPDGYSLNLRCMDQTQFSKVEIVPFDGENWEKNAASLRHLSED